MRQNYSRKLIIHETEIFMNYLIIDETELSIVLSGYEVPKSIIIIVLFCLKVTMSPDIIIFPS
jgi:hypothetical protein